jgi:Fe-S-cluster containining protein
MPLDERPARDASALCLACGLCCNGAFHDLVLLDEDELDGAERHHLPIAGNVPFHAFKLPCPRLDDVDHTRCTIYLERPRGCAAYTCATLAAYCDESLDEPEALERVEATRALFAAVTGRPAGDPDLPAARAALAVARKRWFDP